MAGVLLLACTVWPGGARGQGRELIVAGSWSGLRANESLGRAFAGASGVRVGVHGRDNARGFEYLAAGDMHVLMVSPQRGLAPEQAVEAAFGPDGPHPTGRPVGRFVACVVVHPTNTLSGLSTAQLRDVHEPICVSGKIQGSVDACHAWMSTIGRSGAAAQVGASWPIGRAEREEVRMRREKMVTGIASLPLLGDLATWRLGV